MTVTPRAVRVLEKDRARGRAAVRRMFILRKGARWGAEGKRGLGVSKGCGASTWLTFPHIIFTLLYELT